MKIIHFNSKNYKKFLVSDVYTIGNFDGVHKGHRKLILSTSIVSNILNTSWGVITFVPNTKRFFDKSYRFLNCLDQKLLFFKELMVPKVVTLNFEDIYMLTSKEFIQKYLINILNVKALVAGSNFRLGRDLYNFNSSLTKCNSLRHNNELKQRTTSSQYSIKNSNNFNTSIDSHVYMYTSENLSKIPIYSIKVDRISGKKVSSSIIKKLLQEGNVKESNNLLGYNFIVTSRVMHGQKLGRTLGFPTINMFIPEYVKLKYGIYVTRTILEFGEIKNSVSSFGIRPTIKNSDKQEVLETFIFDYNEDLYNKVVSVEFIDYIREEKKFSSLDDLIVAIKEDINLAKKILKCDKDKHDNKL